MTLSRSFALPASVWLSFLVITLHYGLSTGNAGSHPTTGSVSSRFYQIREGVFYNPVLGFSFDEISPASRRSASGSRVVTGSRKPVEERLRDMGVWLPGDSSAETPGRNENGKIALPHVSLHQAIAPVMVQGSQSSYEIFFEEGVPAEARVVIEASTAVWAENFPSEPVLRIAVGWPDLGNDTLGAAGSPFFIAGTEPTASLLDNNTMYMPSIAASLQGADLLDDEIPHVVMELSSVIEWHFDLNSDAPADRLDLMTVSLHEMCHGLFFDGIVNGRRNETAFVDDEGAAGLVPGRFDRFLGLANNESITSCPEGAPLFEAISNENLRFIDPDTDSSFGLNAPEDYSTGSSVYHLNDTSIFTDCEDNSIPVESCSALMTESLDPGVTQREVGENVLMIMRSVLGTSEGLSQGVCNFGSGPIASPIAPSPVSDAASESTGTATGVIVGAAVGGVVLATLSVMVIAWVIVSKRKEEARQRQGEDVEGQ